MTSIDGVIFMQKFYREKTFKRGARYLLPPWAQTGFFFAWAQGVKGQRRSKNEITLNSKNNSVNVLYMDRDAKVSTVTSLCDLPIRDQRSKKVKM